jgi:hypothetical protein
MVIKFYNFFNQIKTNKEIFQWDFHLYIIKKSDNFFFSKIKIKWNMWKIHFSYILLHLWKTSHKKKACHDMYIWIFPITLSHFGGIAWIFFGVWWVFQPFFEKVVLYLVLWIINRWQSHLGPKLMVWRWWGKQNVKKWMWIFLQPN